MKSRIIHIMLLVTLAAAFLTVDYASASSKNRTGGGELLKYTESEPIALTIPGKSGMSIMLDHSFGNIDVRKGSNDTVSIHGEKLVAANDPDLARRVIETMELRVKENGGNIEIETYYPVDDINKRERKNIGKFTISYTIEIPENVSLRINNEFGNISIGGVSGEFTVTNGFGKIDARDLTGKTELNNKFGGIDAENISGDLRMGNEHSSLFIRTVKGNLYVRTSFGKVDAADISGTASIINGHGEVTAENIGGDTRIETSFSTLRCTDVGGRAELRNSHGAVYAQNIHDNTDITTRFGKVQARNIKGNLTVDDQHASVEIENVAGDAVVNNTFGTVTVSRVFANVDVTNQHSGITVKDILPAKNDRQNRVSLKTSFGTIRAVLPQSLSAKVRASTSQGKFESDFPITVRLKGSIGSGSSDQNIEGVIGDGRNIIELENSHGNIRIEHGGDDMWDFMELFRTVRMFDSE